MWVAESQPYGTKAEVGREELVKRTCRTAGIEGMALQERRAE
jgi:hypothetical protein